MIRNNNIMNNGLPMADAPDNTQSILIMDTGADQCTCRGPAWIPVHDTGDKVQCNGYYQGVGATEGPIVPIMSVVTCAELQGEENFLLLFHQTCYIKDRAQKGILCLPY